MSKFENIIIFILLLFILFFYLRNKKEGFLVQYQPFYPISTELKPRFNNIDNSIEDNRLSLIKKVLQEIKKESNDGSEEVKVFNKINLPVIRNSLELKDIKPITDFILNKANEKLGNSHTIIFDDVKDIIKYGTEEEVKINFKFICQYKIKTNKTISFIKPEYSNNSEENKLIILVELLSKKSYDTEDIYINYIQLSGLTGGEYLPGNNYYNDDNRYMISDYNSEQIISNKQTMNANEVNNMNQNIEDEGLDLVDITMDESKDESMINTEEAESFFNL